MQPTGHPPRGQWQLLWVVSTVICAGDAREQLAVRLPWQTSAAHSSSPTTARPIGLASRHLHIVVFISVGARALLSCHIPPWQPPCEQAPGHMPWSAHGPSSLLSEGPHWQVGPVSSEPRTFASPARAKVAPPAVPPAICVLLSPLRESDQEGKDWVQ